MFRDRKDAGEQLAIALDHYRNRKVLVVGIPRGGVETAYYVAMHLKAEELSVVVTRKLGYPESPKTAFGAVAEDGSYFIFENVERQLQPETIRSIVRKERDEISRRIQYLRDGKPLTSFKGRIVIIVDDGIATGATLLATIKLIKSHEAGRIIVASPVSGNSMKDYLSTLVDEVVILTTPPFYHSVSQAYRSFHNLNDNDVIDLLHKWNAYKDRLQRPEFRIE